MKGWREIPIGAVILEPGNSRDYKTGTWRTFRPVKDDKKCVRCLLCLIYCPEGAIKVNDKVEIDLDFCKGCGICANECPRGAIEMKEEREYVKHCGF